MVGEHDLRLRTTVCYGLFDKCQTTLMFGVEILCIEAVTPIFDAVEITHSALYQIFVFRLDLRPKCGDDDINIRQMHNAIVVRFYVWGCPDNSYSALWPSHNIRRNHGCRGTR